MSKPPMRLLYLIIAIALVFGLLAGSQTATANNPLPETQVLIVSFENRDRLQILADHYDVVEVDHDTQTVKIFSSPTSREALTLDGFTWTVDIPYTREINTIREKFPIKLQVCPDTLASAPWMKCSPEQPNLPVNIPTWLKSSTSVIVGRKLTAVARLATILKSS